MAEPIYLVIDRGPGGTETAAICYDVLPQRHRRKDARPVYMLRLDRLKPEHRDFWLSKSTHDLIDTYRWLRDEGTLPASNIADPPKQAEPRSRKLGDWWTQPVNPWPDQPPAPLIPSE